MPEPVHEHTSGSYCWARTNDRYGGHVPICVLMTMPDVDCKIATVLEEAEVAVRVITLDGPQFCFGRVEVVLMGLPEWGLTAQGGVVRRGSLRQSPP